LEWTPPPAVTTRDNGSLQVKVTDFSGKPLDGAKVVSNAVLQCPKITDSEVEMFASMKNVSDTVLRGIASKRKFMKNYAVKRLLSANPRCPIDVALPLVKELLVMDLKNLSINKNVGDTVRRFAWKMWKEKTTAQHYPACFASVSQSKASNRSTLEFS
jgi:hypothetical protein